MGTLVQLHQIRAEILEVERVVNYNFTNDDLIIIPIVCLTFLVLPINSMIIFWVKFVKTNTLIDNMIVCDCMANIAIFAGFFTVYPKRIWDDDVVCSLVLVFRLFFTLVNRIIPVTIVTYRYILICHSSFADRIGKIRLAKILNFFTFLIPTLTSVILVFFNDNIRVFLSCRGREESFFYETDDFFETVSAGIYFKLPIYHPVRFMSLIFLLAFTVLVPIGYYRIYVFMRIHNLGVQGITSLEFKRRRQRNIITLGLNLSIWKLELLGTIFYLIPFITLYHRSVIFVTITTVISPILYIVNMPEMWNRLELSWHTFCGKCSVPFWKRNAVAPSS